MDKEMKAKVDEFLKTNGRRELSMDEMDKVVGGKDYPYSFSMGGYYIHDDDSLKDFVYNTIAPIEAQFGKDVVVSVLMECLPSWTIKSDYMGAGLAGLENCLYHIATDTLDKK